MLAVFCRVQLANRSRQGGLLGRLTKRFTRVFAQSVLTWLAKLRLVNLVNQSPICLVLLFWSVRLYIRTAGRKLHSSQRSTLQWLGQPGVPVPVPVPFCVPVSVGLGILVS